MSELITIEFIETIYQEALSEAQSKFSSNVWKHKPTGISLDTHKSKYGRATAKGEVLINPAFIGTNAFNKLRATIFHELAHLIVGLSKHHNKVFKRVERILLNGLNIPVEEYEQVKLNNGYKLRLLAYSKENTYDLGGVFKKHKKYTQYTLDKALAIKGDKVLSFEYVPFKKDLPEGTI